MLHLDKLSQERSRRPITTRLTTLQTTHMAPKKSKDPALPEHAYRQTRKKHHTLDENGIKKAALLDNCKHKDRNGAKEIQSDDTVSLQLENEPHAQLEHLAASMQLHDCVSSQGFRHHLCGVHCCSSYQRPSPRDGVGRRTTNYRFGPLTVESDSYGIASDVVPGQHSTRVAVLMPITRRDTTRYVWLISPYTTRNKRDVVHSQHGVNLNQKVIKSIGWRSGRSSASA
jgi:hypothetical protein